MIHLKKYESVYYEDIDNRLVEKWKWIGDSIEEAFFKYSDLAHFELIPFGDDGVYFVTEFYCCDLKPELLIKITEYLKFIEKYGTYEFFAVEPAKGTKDDFVGITAKFLFDKYDDVEKEMIDKVGFQFHPDPKKYNL